MFRLLRSPGAWISPSSLPMNPGPSPWLLLLVLLGKELSRAMALQSLEINDTATSEYSSGPGPLFHARHRYSVIPSGIARLPATQSSASQLLSSWLGSLSQGPSALSSFALNGCNAPQGAHGPCYTLTRGGNTLQFTDFQALQTPYARCAANFRYFFAQPASFISYGSELLPSFLYC